MLFLFGSRGCGAGVELGSMILRHSFTAAGIFDVHAGQHLGALLRTPATLGKTVGKGCREARDDDTYGETDLKCPELSTSGCDKTIKGEWGLRVEIS